MSIDALAALKRQILVWEQRQTKEKSRLLGSKPVVAICAAYGAHGYEIGERVAERLGFDLFDRELVVQIAASPEARAQLLGAVDEGTREWISEHVACRLESNPVAASETVAHISRVVLAIAQFGCAVLMGRGAQFILEPETTLRVRATASLEARIRAIAADEGLDDTEARNAVLGRDAERDSFARLHFNRDVSAAEHYDLVINTDAFSVEQAVELIVLGFRLRFEQPPTQPVPRP